MSSEIRRNSADDPGETAPKGGGSDNRAIHGMHPLLSRQEIADLPDYDGPVPPPLEGADPGNEDPGEPAETTGLGEGYHSPEELRAWLSEHRAGYGPEEHRSDAHGSDAYGSGAPGSDARGEAAGPGSAYGGWAGLPAESEPLTRGEIADLPDYDGDVPAPLPGADPGNEDAGEPAETTGLGEGHHTAAELRAWLARNVWNADDGRTGDGGDGDGGADGAGDGRAAPADESGDPEGTEQARPGTRAAADAAAGQQSQRGEDVIEGEIVPSPREDAREERPEDQPAAPVQTPDVDEAQPAETTPDAGPDAAPEDPMAAMEQRMLNLLAAHDAERDRRDAEREAAHLAELDRLNSRLDEFEARHEEDQAKISELETGREQDRQQIDDLQTEVKDLKEAKQDPGKPDVVTTGEPDEQADPGQRERPHWTDSELPQQHVDTEADKPVGDRPGWLSNAKMALYGAATTGIFGTAAVEWLGSSPLLAAIAGGAIGIAWAIPPVLRERKRKHGD